MARLVSGALTIALVFAFAFAHGTAPAESDRLVPWNDRQAPALALFDLAGRAHRLADYRGQVVLVNFWATWCEPCRDEMPSIARARERFAGQPFAVLAVNHGESATRVQSFVKHAAIDFPILLDPGHDATRAWGVRVLPHSFLVGPDGRVRYSVIGEMDWTSAPAIEAVRRLLPRSSAER